MTNPDALLKQSGLVRLPRVGWIKDFVAYLADRPKHPGHVGSRPRPGISHNKMSDVMTAPYFLDYARSFTPVASNYFGEQAHLWSLNAFYTNPDTPYVHGVNGLHSDREANKILALFVLGYDTFQDGAQLIQTGPDKWDALWGPAGTAWLADTRIPHFGLIPKRPRMIAWARWANCIPQAAIDENLPKVPETNSFLTIENLGRIWREN